MKRGEQSKMEGVALGTKSISFLISICKSNLGKFVFDVNSHILFRDMPSYISTIHVSTNIVFCYFLLNKVKNPVRNSNALDHYQCHLSAVQFSTSRESCQINHFKVIFSPGEKSRIKKYKKHFPKN